MRSLSNNNLSSNNLSSNNLSSNNLSSNTPSNTRAPHVPRIVNDHGMDRVVRGPVVWVLHDDGTKNMFPATKYGSLCIFTRREMPSLDQESIGGWTKDLGEWLSFFNPRTDSILLCGDPVLISTASALLSLMFSRYTVLKWDRQCKEYIPVLLVPMKGVDPEWVNRE